jgi:hypothetical protein
MHITRLIERFLRDQNLPPTKFGRLAARDPRLVLDMRMGREVRPEMEQKLRRFIGTYERNSSSGQAQDHE